MKPAVVDVLMDLEMRLYTQIAPAVSPAYLAGDLGIMGAMQCFVADAWDGAADRLIEENASLRAIFRLAAPVVGNPALAAKLLLLAAAQDPDYRVSTLEAGNDALRMALIETHAELDDMKGPDAARLTELIRAELVRSTERRKASHDNF